MNGALHICAPRAVTSVRVMRCPTCRCRRRMRVDSYEWYDPTVTCGTCGETWTGCERHERPFEPGWRKKSAAYAKAAWSSPPTTTKGGSDMSKRAKKPRIDDVCDAFAAAKAYARAENNKAALRGLATFERGFRMNLGPLKKLKARP